MKKNAERKTAAHYQKIVYWSDEDGCYVGQCPALFLGGVHGDKEIVVYSELCQIVEQHLAILRADGNTPPASDMQEYSGKLTLRIKPALHRALALRAKANGDSLTGQIERTLAKALT
jgi:predicted HicB family RNase H-like nuclease